MCFNKRISLIDGLYKYGNGIYGGRFIDINLFKDFIPDDRLYTLNFLKIRI